VQRLISCPCDILVFNRSKKRSVQGGRWRSGSNQGHFGVDCQDYRTVADPYSPNPHRCILIYIFGSVVPKNSIRAQDALRSEFNYALERKRKNKTRDLRTQADFSSPIPFLWIPFIPSLRQEDSVPTLNHHTCIREAFYGDPLRPRLEGSVAHEMIAHSSSRCTDTGVSAVRPTPQGPCAPLKFAGRPSRNWSLLKSPLVSIAMTSYSKIL